MYWLNTRCKLQVAESNFFCSELYEYLKKKKKKKRKKKKEKKLAYMRLRLMFYMILYGHIYLGTKISSKLDWRNFFQSYKFYMDIIHGIRIVIYGHNSVTL